MLISSIPYIMDIYNYKSISNQHLKGEIPIEDFSNVRAIAAALDKDWVESANFCVFYPTECSRLIFLAKTIVNYAGQLGDFMLFITTTGIWPSSENPNLFYGLCVLHGLKKATPDQCVILFNKNETEAASDFVQVCLLNGWDGEIVNGDLKFRASISHDENVEFIGPRDLMDIFKNEMVANEFNVR